MEEYYEKHITVSKWFQYIFQSFQQLLQIIIPDNKTYIYTLSFSGTGTSLAVALPHLIHGTCLRSAG